MTIEIDGNWRIGRAFDVHTLSSTYLGQNESGYAKWDTTRSEIGELVYQLKYRQDKSKLPAIVTLLDKIKGIEQFNYLIPVPPTDKSRAFQPVQEIALALGAHRGVTVLTDFLAKRTGGQQIKNVNDAAERERLLRENMHIQATYPIAGSTVLLIDDLYRSGATLRVATELLLNQAKASDVCVLTMTRAKSNR
jgi:competence protein ComFC